MIKNRERKKDSLSLVVFDILEFNKVRLFF